MLKYIREIVSPELGKEVYEIGYQGNIYTFSDGDKLSEFLSQIKKNIEKEIITNESRSATIEIDNASLKGKRILQTPLVLQYSNRNKKLSEQIKLIESLENHLSSSKIEDDIFSAEAEKDAGFKERIRLELGFKPRTFSELKIYRGIIERKVKKLCIMKQSSENKREHNFRFNVSFARVASKEEVDNIYASKLKSLEEKRDRLSEAFGVEDNIYDTECERVDHQVDVAFTTILPFLNAQLDESKKEKVREALREYFRDQKFEDARKRYFSVTNALNKKREEIDEYIREADEFKRAISREISKYNRYLRREASLAKRIDEIRNNGTSYVKKYK